MFQFNRFIANRRFRVFFPALIAVVIWAALPVYSFDGPGLFAADFRLYAPLTGAPIGGMTPAGTAEYRQEVGRRRLDVFVNSVNLPTGTMVNVVVMEAASGSSVLASSIMAH